MEAQRTGLGIDDVIGEKRDAVLRLAYQHGARNVRIFGSVARGEATPDSDIDLLVEWDYERLSPWGGAGLYDELAALLGHQVDIVSEDYLNPLIKPNVLREAVAL